MSDIVERLREDRYYNPDFNFLAREAADEIERLRAQIEEFKTEREYVWGFNAGFDEAKEQARDEIERLRQALKPFVDAFEKRRDAYSHRYKDCELGYANFDKMPNHWPMESVVFTMSAFRDARATLKEVGGGDA